jgi:hypothetical protein
MICDNKIRHSYVVDMYCDHSVIELFKYVNTSVYKLLVGTTQM